MYICNFGSTDLAVAILERYTEAKRFGQYAVFDGPGLPPLTAVLYSKWVMQKSIVEPGKFHWVKNMSVDITSIRSPDINEQELMRTLLSNENWS
jgi:hypothetical protein